MRFKMLFLAGAIAVLVPVVVAGLALAGSTRSETTVASAATAEFHNLAAAQAAGYTAVVQDLAGNTCIAQAGAGGMGVHYLNPTLLDDSVDAATPEALVYGPGPNSQLRLVALEYLAFQDPWDATHSDPPSLFGQEFMLTGTPNRYGIPAFYSLHLWIWDPNPSGLFQPWNPRVACPA
jgi:hypothetical protein